MIKINIPDPIYKIKIPLEYEIECQNKSCDNVIKYEDDFEHFSQSFNKDDGYTQIFCCEKCDLEFEVMFRLNIIPDISNIKIKINNPEVL